MLNDKWDCLYRREREKYASKTQYRKPWYQLSFNESHDIFNSFLSACFRTNTKVWVTQNIADPFIVISNMAADDHQVISQGICKHNNDRFYPCNPALHRIDWIINNTSVTWYCNLSHYRYILLKIVSKLYQRVAFNDKLHPKNIRVFAERRFKSLNSMGAFGDW